MPPGSICDSRRNTPIRPDQVIRKNPFYILNACRNLVLIPRRTVHAKEVFQHIDRDIVSFFDFLHPL